jgi:hypothetical protein
MARQDGTQKHEWLNQHIPSYIPKLKACLAQLYQQFHELFLSNNLFQNRFMGEAVFSLSRRERPV